MLADGKNVIEEQKMAKRKRMQTQKMFNSELKEIEEIISTKSRDSGRSEYFLVANRCTPPLTINSDDDGDE